MFFLMIVLSIVPLGLGWAIRALFGKTKLSKSLFIFMCLISIWQMDVAILFASNYLSIEMIDRLFRFFRFGTIMLPPSILYVTSAILIECVEKKALSRKWSLLIKNKVIGIFTIWSLIIYIVGFFRIGIDHLYLVQSEHTANFLFPKYGSYSWVFNLIVPLFFISICICLAASRRVTNVHIRSFLSLFIFTSIFAYIVGTLNMFPQIGLYPSSIAVLIFAIAVFIGFCLMHSKVVKEMNKTLFDQKEFLRKVIDANPNFIYTKTMEGELTLANLSLAEMLGKSMEAIIGKKEEELFTFVGDWQPWQSEEAHHAESADGASNVEENIIDAQGNKRSFQSAKIPLTISGSSQMLCVSTDITERKQYEGKILEIAYHDTLTGLFNRLSFNDELIKAIQFNHNQVVLMFIDLDRFKTINDTLGHAMGDLFLRLVAERLSSTLNEYGTVFRIGGDEFVFLLQNSTELKAALLADKILNCFKAPFYLGAQETYSTPSIGISASRDGSNDGETLMKRADMAMHRAKEEGKNTYRFYEPEMDCINERKMELEKELRKAVQNQDFFLHYQPQFSLSTGSVVGVEALIRWKHATLGSISPAEFIPLAEETGLIVSIGEWVLRKACEQLKAWKQAGLQPIRIAVNISLRQFYETNLVETVERILKAADVDAQLLELEITESVAMHNTEQVINKLMRLKRLGIIISMDDFGTGYSSLNYLKKLPIDKLKIDQSFLIDVINDKDNAAIVSTIIVMAQKLDLQVVAEGVENESQLRFLKHQNCNEAQGYYFSEPIAEDEITRFLFA